MYNFFVDDGAREKDVFRITGADYRHMRNVLRMREGENLLVSAGGMSHLCCLERYGDGEAEVRILEEDYRNTELPVQICLFQGLPKAEKMEWIVQKCVELGASEFIPVEMHRSVLKLDEKRKESRRQRWQAIAESAAKQSKRSVIPAVGEVLTYREAMERAREMDLFLIPYENRDGMNDTRASLEAIRPGMRIGILIGPEGGFEENEIAAARDAGGRTVSLGRRILRTETAAVTAVAMCMLHVEMSGEGNGESA